MLFNDYNDQMMNNLFKKESFNNIYDKNKNGNVLLTGTTTLSIRCKDGVVFGTDRRATAGYYVASKHAKKTHKINQSAAMTIAGVVADAQALIDILRIECNLYNLKHEHPISVLATARLLSNILFERRWFPYYTQLLIGGYDNTGARVFSMDPVGSLIEEKTISATGSGTTYAIAVLEDGYHEGITIKEAIPMAIHAVRTSIERDIGSGNGIDITVIDKNGYNELSNPEIEKELEKIGKKIKSFT
ncbi:MAG: archaeal proteasome endopeptidase complex subunit beta [Candidatus Lokiarchaeota archaeon]|nr:archaeal proteasome endopeptidase complex subunit beta [Candidatus Lokiarchaeota archaeon]